MANQICFQCFKVKGDYEVCPHCGYVENTKAEQVYQLAPGTVLRERYIIGTSIGFGGFGITYKAYDTALGVVVAIKEFYPAGLVNRGEGEMKVGIFSGDKEQEFKRQLARFLEEAKNMASFSKEKDIINVYDYFEENQTAYIIMEYVDAPLLKTRLREEGRMPAEEAEGYMRAILDAMSKIHARGIIHKDISPDNIFLTGEKEVKIFDFGAAKFEGTESERTEVVVVKAGYTPPEQYRSKNEQGYFMDVYAAGAVFYEMLTGEKPMDAPDRAAADELKKPSEYGIQIGENTERVILKALALRPEQRFQTAEEFKNAIVRQKKVELPEEEIEKYRRRKKALTIASASVIAVVGVIVILSQTLFSGRGKLDVADIREDKLEMWISAENDAAGEELKEAFLDSVEKECPQLAVTISVVPREKYAAKLQQAAEEGSLPDVFCTEGIEADDYCEDLSMLMKTLKRSSFLYLDDLWDGKGMYELPTAVQLGVAYVTQELAADFTQAADFAQLEKQGETLGYADEEGVFQDFQDGRVAVVAGGLSDLQQIKAVTVEQLPPTDFAAVPIVKEEKLLGTLGNCYGVNRDADPNRKKAGMFLLSLLLSNGMQSAAYMDNEDGIPLNREIFENYKETKMTTYLAALKEYDLEEAEIFPQKEICQAIREEIGEEEE